MASLNSRAVSPVTMPWRVGRAGLFHIGALQGARVVDARHPHLSGRSSPLRTLSAVTWSI